MDYKNELLNLLQNVNDWESLKNKLENQYNTSIQKDGKKNTLAGKLFEYFTKYFFLCNQLFQNDIKNAWLLEEVPLEIKEKLNINHVDHGIDLVLENTKEEYIAVQCKFKNDETLKLGWSKDKLGNLFGFASSIDKLIIFSNASEIDDVSRTRTDNLCFISIKDLLELDEDFFADVRNYITNNKKIVHKKATPFAYQTKIINEVNTYYKDNTRGKLILPCGTGKTLISLWIREELNSKLTLFLVPSLNLVRQTKNEWLKNCNNLFDYIIVCSENDIDNEQDSANIQLYDLDSFVTEEPEAIRSFIKTKSERNKIIFSTYQSFQKIIDAYEEELPQIDLAICDEAHRTASINFGAFSLIHNDVNKMKIQRRLYMTATPRVYSQTIKKNIEESGNLLFDMSDEDTYGKEIYRMSFAEAIELGILVDYQIVCLGVNDDNVHKLLSSNIYIDGKNSITDYVNNYAVQLAFNKYSISHAITFHSKVKQAEQFAERNYKISPDIQSYFVSGNQTASKRSLIISDFKNKSKSIISNARCLTEGVDIPAVDAVFFCDPKNSKVDIVQAVGRALRKDKNNPQKIGKVIIPLYFSKDSDVEDEIDKSIYSNVVKIVRAIADHDERLQDEINTIAVKGSSNGNFSRIQFYQESKLGDLIAFENIGEKIKNSLFDEIISKNSITWNLYFKELEEYLKQNNNIFPKQNDNAKLYKWCSQQRVFYSKNQLSAERVKLLESINFSWSVNDDAWNEKYLKLVDFRKNNPDHWPKFRNTTGEEHSLAIWMMHIDKEYKEERLKQDRYEKLLSIDYQFEDRNWYEIYDKHKKIIDELGHLPSYSENVNIYNWLRNQYEKIDSGKFSSEQLELLRKINIDSFNDVVENWENRYKFLKEYYDKNNCLPSISYDFGYITKINYGTWATIQRLKFRNGELTDEQIQKLESIGFVLDSKTEKESIWDEKCEKLKKWLESHNNEYPKDLYSNDKEEAMLASFVQYNRNWYFGKLKKYGDYPAERKAKLDSIGFDWGEKTKTQTLTKKWGKNFEELKQQLNELGSIPVLINGKNNPSYTWLTGQRVAYRNGKLSDDKIQKLKELNLL